MMKISVFWMKSVPPKIFLFCVFVKLFESNKEFSIYTDSLLSEYIAPP